MAFDHLIATMVRRSTVTFILFSVAVAALSTHFDRRLRIDESYLLAAAYVFFFVLLAYLAAFLNFYLAYVLSLAAIGTLIYLYLRWILTAAAGFHILGFLVAFQLVPTVAVILQGYTGLIYTLEILVGLTGLMLLTTRPFFRRIVDSVLDPMSGQEVAHAQ